MGQMFIITIVLTVLVAVLSGCATASMQPEAIAPEPTPPVLQIAPTVTEPAAKIAAKAVDAEGILNGRIDNNSVEIEINPEDTLAFRVTDVLDQLEGIKDGDLVRFSYESNEDGQLNITKIEKVK
ncbi:MAG TPA: hypothetical protein VEG39_07530 [Clostridia bacterium]|nr:hypothetical protein [Clostridia bacterium]